MKQETGWTDFNGGSWGIVRITDSGFLLERYSRYSGTMTNQIVIVPFEAEGIPISSSDDLDELDEQGTSAARRIDEFAVRFPERCIIRNEGFLVQ